MLITKTVKHSALYLIAGITVVGCQHKTPPRAAAEPPAETPPFTSTNYPMMVKGKTFIIDAPWNDTLSLEQQQDALFASANGYEADTKSARKYVKVEKITNNSAQYIVKSGLQLNSPDHNFDTFLQFTLSTNCKHIQTTLHCEFNAIDGLYSVDLPNTTSLNAGQTPTQMEQNEIATLTKLINHQLKVTETFKTSLPLSTLKTILTKQRFLVDSKKPNLYLSRLQYNYEVELSQEKVKEKFETTVRYYINPTSIDTYHADYATPLNLAKKDFQKTINQ